MRTLKFDRRSFLQRSVLGGAVGGFFAFALRNRSDALFAGEPSGRAKRCVVLWMDGGPSQIDTFDPKPGEQTGGQFRAIETAVKGVRIGEHLPRIAQRMQELSIIRSITSPEGDHLRAQYLFHTGFRLVEGFPRPAVGSVVSRHSPPAGFPRFVSVGAPGFGPAYMGPAHAPFAIEDARQAHAMLRRLETRRSRLELLDELGRDFSAERPSALLEQRREVFRRIEDLFDTPFVDALDLRNVTRSDRERYGEHEFGRRCLLARRLLETGVKFVEVQQGGWDTHVDNFSNVERLCGLIDRPWAALLDDLKSRGLLDDTIVLWMGEFGRTPQINARNGRDHYPRATCAVIGGGGLRGGEVVGATDRLGLEVTKDRVSTADVFATLFTGLGIDPKKRFETEFGATATATDEGTPIVGLV